MANQSGPGQFTFDQVTGALLTTGGGGGSSDVNIAEVGGNTVGLNHPLPVELSDGTNALGTDANPLVVEGAPSGTSTAPASTAVGAAASTLLAANPTRLEAMVVNTGITVIFLALGQTPTTSAYHVALAACSTANDGTGGTFTTDIWKGTIRAITAAAGTVCVTELTA